MSRLTTLYSLEPIAPTQDISKIIKHIKDSGIPFTTPEGNLLVSLMYFDYLNLTTGLTTTKRLLTCLD